MRLRRRVVAGLMAVMSFPVAARPAEVWLTGVNLADGAFNPERSRLHFDYTYPTLKELDYFADKGFRAFRVPVIAHRIFPPAGGSPEDWRIVSEVIAHAAKRDARVILDLHQFGGMRSGLVGLDAMATDEFVAFWRQAAERLKSAPNVVFGLMNEPNKQSAAEWLSGANAAIAAIRKAGAHQLILVPGSYWDGAYTWTTTDNSKVMEGVQDPDHNFAYELHQYLDADSSGTSKEVVDGTGATRLAAFTEWARAHHARGFLGEFGFADTPQAMKEGEDLVAYMARNKDVWSGWTYWAAGQWWGDYMFSVEPNKTGDKPQMAVLVKWK